MLRRWTDDARGVICSIGALQLSGVPRRQSARAFLPDGERQLCGAIAYSHSRPQADTRCVAVFRSLSQWVTGITSSICRYSPILSILSAAGYSLRRRSSNVPVVDG